MPTSRSYQAYLIESLKDPEEAAAYLEAVLEDGSEEEVLLALRDVAEARLAAVNSDRGDSETIQQILSSPEHLDMMTLLRMLGELGFKLSVTPKENAA